MSRLRPGHALEGGFIKFRTSAMVFVGMLLGTMLFSCADSYRGLMANWLKIALKLSRIKHIHYSCMFINHAFSHGFPFHSLDLCGSHGVNVDQSYQCFFGGGNC